MKFSSIYLHIGNNRTVREKRIIGVFDMDTATVSPITRDYLRKQEQQGLLYNTKEEVPKSLVLTEQQTRIRGRKQKKVYAVYMTPLSPRAICGRSNEVK